MMKEQYTDEQVLTAIRDADEVVDGSLSANQFGEIEGISRTTVRRRFDAWNNAKEQAGVETTYSSSPDETGDNYLSRLKKWAECQRCGFKEPPALDFHHKNPEEKSFNLGKNDIKKATRRYREVIKCVCLCSNCHRLHHSDNYDFDANEMSIPDYPKPGNQ